MINGNALNYTIPYVIFMTPKKKIVPPEEKHPDEDYEGLLSSYIEQRMLIEYC